MHSSIIVANYFICRALAEGKSLTPLQVMKLVYYAHGYNLAVNNEPIINEKVQAWKYGPVIESLYHELKEYGKNGIQNPLVEEVWQDEKEFTDDELEILDAVYEELSNLNGLVLSDLTHKKGTPWEKSFKGNQRRISIDDEMIKHYFREALG